MTTPKCIHCNDTGRLIGSDYFDCVHCGTAFARIALRDAINQFAETDAGAFGNENLVWFIHQRATSMARASALAELHPNWLAEKERADRAEAELAALRAAPLPADTDKLREALKMAMIQNSCDMLMTSEEMRQCEAALASTAGQAPVREVPMVPTMPELLDDRLISDWLSQIQHNTISHRERKDIIKSLRAALKHAAEAQHAANVSTYYAQVRRGEWIKPEDNLPAIYEEVRVMMDGVVRIGRLNHDKTYFQLSNYVGAKSQYIWTLDRVHGWQPILSAAPLPAAPAQTESKP